MKPTVSVERDHDQILSIYISIHSGKVARTVEIAEGACYADEDANGDLLGVEMIAPGELQINLKAASKHYRAKYPQIEKLLENALAEAKV